MISARIPYTLPERHEDSHRLDMAEPQTRKGSFGGCRPPFLNPRSSAKEELAAEMFLNEEQALNPQGPKYLYRGFRK